MQKYTGIPASGGIAIAKIKLINKRILGYKRVVLTSHRELELYKSAIILAKDELKNLMQHTDEQRKDILNFQLVLLDDTGLNETIKSKINQGFGSAFAVEESMYEYCDKIKKINDTYLSARSIDIQDVLTRVIDILDGKNRQNFTLTQPSIIISDDILPSDLACLERELTLGFITADGSYQNHANIIARTMGIPSVCAIGSEILNPLNNGKTVAIDGYTGEVYISPNESIIAMLNHKNLKEQRPKVSTIIAKDSKIINSNNKEISIYANCNDPTDITKAIKNGAQGVGLIRSEILFMKSYKPTLESQEEFYSNCIKAANGLPITIRVFDMGADKPIENITDTAEANPALGMRGIRLLQKHPDIFKVQLQALYKAANNFGKVNVMVPMVTSCDEFLDYLAFAEDIKSKLLKEKIITKDNVNFGVMIETPAAALISDQLAKHANFFSIGTNDLTQYTLAADRINENVSSYYDPLNTAVIQLMQIAIQNAKNNNIPVSICGESAADVSCAKLYAEMDINALSMAQNAMIPVKEQLIEIFNKK